MIIVLVNVIFVIIGFYIFVREYCRDRRHAVVRRASVKASSRLLLQAVKRSKSGSNAFQAKVKITPVSAAEKEKEILERFKNMSHNIDIHDIHDDTHINNVIEEHHGHEERLNELNRKRSKKAKRNTQLRLLSRAKLKSSKTLLKVPGK